MSPTKELFADECRLIQNAGLSWIQYYVQRNSWVLDAITLFQNSHTTGSLDHYTKSQTAIASFKPYTVQSDLTYYFELSDHYFRKVCCCLVTKSCPILCDPMNCSSLGSSVWNSPRQDYWSGLPFLFSRSSWSRDWTHISFIPGRFFTSETPGKPLEKETLCNIYCRMKAVISLVLPIVSATFVGSW